MPLWRNAWRRVTATPTDTLTPAQLTAAEAFDDGYRAGWADALRTLEQHDLEQRDELLARRIVALLLQHGYNQELAASVARTAPYAQRGIPRRVTT